jgi:hypothetical protein
MCRPQGRRYASTPGLADTPDVWSPSSQRDKGRERFEGNERFPQKRRLSSAKVCDRRRSHCWVLLGRKSVGWTGVIPVNRLKSRGFRVSK